MSYLTHDDLVEMAENKKRLLNDLEYKTILKCPKKKLTCRILIKDIRIKRTMCENTENYYVEEPDYDNSNNSFELQLTKETIKLLDEEFIGKDIENILKDNRIQIIFNDDLNILGAFRDGLSLSRHPNIISDGANRIIINNSIILLRVDIVDE